MILAIIIIFWLCCGFVLSWNENKYSYLMEWQDVLYNFLLGPIKLSCELVLSFLDTLKEIAFEKEEEDKHDD